MKVNTILNIDALSGLKSLPNESVDMLITSPPYWGLRDYGHDDQLGLESDFRDYINNLCDVFDEVKRVLKPEGTCWVNIGDTYANTSTGGQGATGGRDKSTLSSNMPPVGTSPIKRNKQIVGEKCLIQIPARFAIEMTSRGWILRNEIIWHKPNAMPQSVKDRFSVDFEKLFFFTKSKKYYFEQQFDKALTFDTNIRDRDTTKLNNVPGRSRMSGLTQNNYENRNKRSVWSILTKSYAEAHFAVYPEALITTPILAGCPEGGVVLDPFFGSGTTGLVADKFGRKWIGIEINAEYITLAQKRLQQETLF